MYDTRLVIGSYSNDVEMSQACSKKGKLFYCKLFVVNATFKFKTGRESSPHPTKAQASMVDKLYMDPNLSSGTTRFTDTISTS